MPLRKQPQDKKQDVNPSRRCDYTEADVQALRAVARGEATAHQQRQALDFIVYDMADTYGNSMRSDDRYTSFALGKQHVGQSIVYFLNAAKVTTDPDKIAARQALPPEQNDESS